MTKGKESGVEKETDERLVLSKEFWRKLIINAEKDDADSKKERKLLAEKPVEKDSKQGFGGLHKLARNPKNNNSQTR